MGVNKRVGVLFAMVLLGQIAGCASIDRRVAAANAAPGEIHWPDEYAPEAAPFFVHHQIEIAAPPNVVWGVLIEAETWPTWYEGAADVSVQGAADELRADSVFHWKTMGLRFESRVAEFEPPTRLSWESKHRFIAGYHAWLLLPKDGGTLLITDESMGGFLAYMQRIFLPNRLNQWHENWLQQIKRRAESRAADASAEASSSLSMMTRPFALMRPDCTLIAACLLNFGATNATSASDR
ncbi:MAG: SRPBCC domain-containing protein [Pseudomonadota bacterium]